MICFSVQENIEEWWCVMKWCVFLADSLRHTSALAVFLALVFLVITAGIVIAKWLQGTTKTPRFLPDVADINSIWTLFTVVPVLVTAYVCHFNGN